MSDFFANANFLSIALMIYAANVMMEALRRDQLDPHGINSPLILKNKVSAWFMIASVPCAFLPAVYVAFYVDWKYGLVSWIVQAIGAVITIVFGLGRRYISFHFITACIVFPIGYYLCVADMLS